MELKTNIYINGKYSKLATEKLESFFIEDNISSQLDSLELAINNAQDSIAIPVSKSTIELAIGYGVNIYRMGNFIAQNIEASPSSIGIRAIAQDLNLGREKKNRIYKDKTLEDILKTLANDLDLSLKIDSMLGSKKIKYYLQENKTSLEVLDELSEIFFAIANIKNNSLVFLSKDNNKNLKINTEDILSITKQDIANKYYNGVVCNNWNMEEGQLETTKLGNEPYLLLQNIVDDSIRNSYINSKYKEIQEKECIKLSVKGNPEYQAGFSFTLKSIKQYSQFNGRYRIEKATHIYNGGSYTTNIEAIKI